jgi:hypothetical protein
MPFSDSASLSFSLEFRLQAAEALPPYDALSRTQLTTSPTTRLEDRLKAELQQNQFPT